MPRTLRKTKILYHIHKRPPSVPVLNQINPVHILSTDFFNISLISVSYLRLGIESSVFPLGFHTKTR